MADDDQITGISQEQINNVIKLRTEMENLIRRKAQLAANNTLTKESTDALNQSISSLSNEITNIISKMDSSTRKAFELAGSQNAINTAVNAVKQQFGQMGGVLSQITGEIGRGLTGAMSNYGQIVGAIGSSTYRNFVNPLNDGALSIMGLIPAANQLNEAIGNLRRTQTTARVAFTLFGDSSEQAKKSISDFPNALRRSSAATAISTQNLNDMAKTMQIVPGALALVNTGIAGIADTQNMAIQPMAALATVSRAFGMTSAEAATMGLNAWRNFGQTTEETITQMGKMADASRQTGVDRRTANEQIERASENLAIFGQKTGAAASTWATFMSSLRNAGVPISQIGSMVNTVTQNIANMTVQNRAFISMVSGMSQGRTALGGALQLELAMRTPEGMQKNLEALTSTLSQFAGGKIITIEEAARNPQLEMQFQLQRQMLQRLNGITNQEQQNRVLETLQNVQRGGMSQVEGSRALSDVYKQGLETQEKEITVLQRMEQFLRQTFDQNVITFLRHFY